MKLTCSEANEIIQNKNTVVFGTLIQLLDYIKDTYKDSATGDSTVVTLSYNRNNKNVSSNK